MKGIMDSLPPTQTKSRKSFLRSLWVQVMIAIVLGVVLGRLDPAKAIAMKPLGDGFLRLITMVITCLLYTSDAADE